MNPNEPQPAPKGVGRDITPLVIQDLQMRSKMGAEKYGEALRAFNGRDPLVDAYQEAMDLVQYLRQAIEEKQRPQDALMEHSRMSARQFLVEREKFNLPLTAQLEPSPFVAFHPWIDPLAPIELTESESIAQEAHRLVHGERQEAYGHPIFDMTRTADMVTALLRDKLRSDARLEAEDIAQVMICVKQSRERNRHKRDNQTDTAGYSLTKEMIADWRVANPGVDPRDVFPAA